MFAHTFRTQPDDYLNLKHSHRTNKQQTESAFHKILLGPVAGAASSSSSRPTTPEEAAANAVASATAGAAAVASTIAPVAPVGATEEDEQAAAQAHVRVSASLLAAVAVVACQGGGQEKGRIALGARALLVHTLRKADTDAAGATAAGAGADMLSRVLFGGESMMGLAHVHAGIAAATAALLPSASSHAEGNGEEDEDEVVARLLAGAVAKGVLAAGDLGAARVSEFSVYMHVWMGTVKKSITCHRLENIPTPSSSQTPTHTNTHSPTSSTPPS